MINQRDCASSDMQDILKDWRRWSPAERVMAILIASILMIGVPMGIAINLSSTMLSQSGGEAAF